MYIDVDSDRLKETISAFAYGFRLHDFWCQIAIAALLGGLEDAIHATQAEEYFDYSDWLWLHAS